MSRYSLLVAFALCGCSDEAATKAIPSLTVNDVLREHAHRDGQEIELSGVFTLLPDGGNVGLSCERIMIVADKFPAELKRSEASRVRATIRGVLHTPEQGDRIIIIPAKVLSWEKAR